MFIVQMKRINDDHWFDIDEQTETQKKTLAGARAAARVRWNRNQKQVALRNKSGVRIIERVETILHVLGEV